jgi:hypothetical protein
MREVCDQAFTLAMQDCQEKQPLEALEGQDRFDVLLESYDGGDEGHALTTELEDAVVLVHEFADGLMTSCGHCFVNAIGLHGDCFPNVASESFSLVFAVLPFEPQLKSHFETDCQEEIHHSSLVACSHLFDILNAMRKEFRECHDCDERPDSHSIFEDDECFLCVLCSFCSEGVPLGQAPHIMSFLPLFLTLLDPLVIFQLLLPSAAPLKE